MNDSHPEAKRALITGASMGIGAAFARQLAARGHHLVLVARSAGKLEALAVELRQAHGVQVDVVPADLVGPGAVAKVMGALAERRLGVDLLVNNAGFATHGGFEVVSIARQLEEIQLNVMVLVELTHALLPQLLDRRGAIINVASTAAFQPLATMAVYGATKAFVLSFSEALFAEYERRGVRVLALCPGATDTPFFEVAGEAAAVGAKASPDEVVRVGLAALERGRTTVVHGAQNWLTTLLPRLFPRAMVARVTRGVLERNARRATALPPSAPPRTSQT